MAVFVEMMQERRECTFLRILLTAMLEIKRQLLADSLTYSHRSMYTM